jgi:hypothetical protein
VVAQLSERRDLFGDVQAHDVLRSVVSWDR